MVPHVGQRDKRPPGRRALRRQFPWRSMAARSLAQPSSAMSQAKRPRILVIDDEPLIGCLIVRVLGRGYDVATVVHGQQGLDVLAADDKFDLVLCDLMMPGLTGMDVHAALAQRGSRQAATMIFLTGGAFVGHAGEFLARVPNPCLEKPFLAEELRAAVHNALASPSR